MTLAVSPRRTLTLLVALLSLIGAARGASAQGFGIGPRVSFVRGDLTTGVPSENFIGGTIRMRSSKHLIFEIAMDYRSQLTTDHEARVREVPLQASLLIVPIHARFAPYLLGGFGAYSQLTDTLDVTGKVTSTTTDRKTGWHLGVGAEMLVARHASIFLDYRFRFVQLGDTPAGAEPITIPGSTLVPGLENVNLSHQGSMWTSGMAFYF